MKIINKIITVVILLLTIMACTSNFEEINTNPNTTTVGEIKASSLFEPLLYNGADYWLNYTWFWNDELIQFTAFTGGTTRQEHRYFISDGNWQSVWNAYSRYANNTVHMHDLAVKDDDRSLEAISRTLKVLFMSNLTDMYGDVPYSEAFKILEGGGRKPKFDSQREVYAQMFAELDSANVIYLEQPVFVKPELDGMYNGAMEKWQKFNNSLYMRLLMRVSGRSEMNVGSKLTEIVNNPKVFPVFNSNDDNATVVYTGTDPYRNYFANTNEGDFTSSGRKLTEQLIKMTVVTEDEKQVYQDPRLAIIGKKNPSAQTNPENKWIGTVAGVKEENRSDVDRGTSWLNAADLARPAAPGFFMDYAEVQFILAEATQRGLIPGGTSQAKEHYTKAVTASVDKWAQLGQYSDPQVTVSEGDITTFLASDLASWDKASDKLQLIGSQKYLALFWIGMEAYHEYRRTGYPELTIGDGANFNDFILPTRFAYPNTTMATNGINAQEALIRMGGENTMKTPVWWSKQAIEEGK
jgi:hypothetical protein